ncbi:MAG: hypothetical protein WCK41_10885 [Actinomycetes bacterium]
MKIQTGDQHSGDQSIENCCEHLTANSNGNSNGNSTASSALTASSTANWNGDWTAHRLPSRRVMDEKNFAATKSHCATRNHQLG